MKTRGRRKSRKTLKRSGSRRRRAPQTGGAPVTPPPSQKFRFHVLAVPHTVTRKDYSACAFTQKVLKFCKMMTARGHTVYHYGHADSEVEATEHVPVTDNEVLQKAYGTYDWRKEIFKHSVGDHANTVFNQRAIEEIKKRKQPNDFLLMFWGLGHAEIPKALPDMLAVEPGIGCFNTPSAPYNIFESYSVMNYIYGREKWEPRWQDAVIPNYFDLADFTFEPKKGEYFVYLGRIIKAKGLDIAVKMAQAAGIKLKVAGQGDLKAELGYEPPADVVEVVGYVEPEARSELLQGARALLAPTHYNEPFGGVTIEAMFCGTPIITSDWGAFAENNLHGVTGYRCRNLEQFLWAAKNIEKIDRGACRFWAEKNFTLEHVAPMYEEYFKGLLGYAGGADGFSAPEKGDAPRTELDWLVREYPPSK